jgi:hypothetical protein
MAAFTALAVQALLRAIATRDAFRPDNDPRGEHDFGAEAAIRCTAGPSGARRDGDNET